MNINNKKCLVFEKDIKKDKINEFFNFENEYFGPKAPEFATITKKDIINICKDFIINYELDKDDIIELFIMLLKPHQCRAQLLNNVN